MGEKISIKLQHRLQRFIIQLEPLFPLFFPSALLPARDDMTTALAAVTAPATWVVVDAEKPSSAAAAAAATCVVNILHGPVRGLFFFFPFSQNLNGPSYNWLLINGRYVRFLRIKGTWNWLHSNWLSGKGSNQDGSKPPYFQISNPII
jgi:hypothetical protein